jgi:hypothetical protein
MVNKILQDLAGSWQADNFELTNLKIVTPNQEGKIIGKTFFKMKQDLRENNSYTPWSLSALILNLLVIIH